MAQRAAITLPASLPLPPQKPNGRPHQQDSHVIYIASPYAHSDPEVRRLRFEQVCHYVAERMLQGAVVYSPIAHSHPICERFALPVTLGLLAAFRPLNDPARLCARGLDAGRLAPLSRRHGGDQLRANRVPRVRPQGGLIQRRCRQSRPDLHGPPAHGRRCDRMRVARVVPSSHRHYISAT